MTGYLGTTARLLPVVPTAAQREVAAERYVFRDARTRRWAFDMGAVRPRSWSIDTSVMSTSEQQALSEVWSWGAGPFRWVSCAAHASNVLTPSQTALAGLSQGPVDAVDGWSPVSVIGPSPVTVAAGAAVLPGKPATVALDASGAATMTVTFRAASGGVVGTQTVQASGTVMQRLTWTGVAPASARTVDLDVTGHVRACRPQVTWTDKPVPWTAGLGATSVVMQQRDVDLVSAWGGHAWWDGTVTLVEVG